jgi:subtilase family serine protease
VIAKRLLRKGLPLLAAVALLTGPLVASAQALPAAPPLGGQASRAAQSSVNQPAVNPDHVKVLAAALQKMHDNYPAFANFTPGPQDIFDYNIGNLWLKGIDGSGTTVAVIEGWDDPNVAAFIHVRDVRYGLPDPVIQTIYPSGPLPAQCPAGMVALGSYGSCDAWVGT